ncbi:hypothetical protein [Kutzneria sp. NPDC051319]|uniref:hypothetical protein n=1 Tax=Kutzneria sp. NPDC051319 TaxID=3155047 RepID=UPI0034453956
MIEGGVVVAYLVALLGGAARRFMEGRAEAAMNGLYNAVARKFGGIVSDLRADPKDQQAQQRLARAVENTATVDPRFAEQLTALVDRLDRAGGRQFLNQVQAHTNVQNFGSGMAVGRDYVSNTWRGAERHENLSGAPAWVKVVTAIGAVAFAGGFGLLVVKAVIVMSTMQDEFGRPQFPGIDDLAPGGIVLGVGLVFLMLGSLGRSLSRRGW